MRFLAGHVAYLTPHICNGSIYNIDESHLVVSTMVDELHHAHAYRMGVTAAGKKPEEFTRKAVEIRCGDAIVHGLDVSVTAAALNHPQICHGTIPCAFGMTLSLVHRPRMSFAFDVAWLGRRCKL